MSLLPELRLIACDKTRDAFNRNHHGLYLLAVLPTKEEDLDFHTVVAEDPMAQADSLLSGDATQLLADKRLFHISKTPRNPWQSKITIGRASNNDLIIRHPSISKLHAYFQHEAEASGSVAKLVDAGSANGTVVNGYPAPPDKPVDVSPGSLLQVGDVECELLDAGQLHDTIRALFPTPELLRSL